MHDEKCFTDRDCDSKHLRTVVLDYVLYESREPLHLVQPFTVSDSLAHLGTINIQKKNK